MSKLRQTVLQNLVAKKYEVRRIVHLFNAYRSFGRILIEKFSKEFEPITDTIEVLLHIYSCICHYNMDAMNNVEIYKIIEEGMGSITELIAEWFSKEFNHSIMIGFNLEQIPHEEIMQNNQLISKYRQLLVEFRNAPPEDQIAMNEDFTDPMMMRQMNRNPNDVRRQIKHFGLTNETDIYRRLFGIKLARDDLSYTFYKFLAKDLFSSRIKKRISNGYFSEVIRFRVYFQFEQNFGEELGRELKQIVDSRIIDQIVNNSDSDSQSDFTTLCKQLSDRTPVNKELMNQYMDNLFGKKVPEESCSDNAGLRFVLEWDCLPTLISIDSEMKAKGLTRPLNNPTWEKRFAQFMSLFTKTINNIADSSERIGLIRVYFLLKMFFIYSFFYIFLFLAHKRPAKKSVRVIRPFTPS